MGNGVGKLETRVEELEAATDGLLEELVEVKSRCSKLEDEFAFKQTTDEQEQQETSTQTDTEDDETEIIVA